MSDFRNDLISRFWAYRRDQFAGAEDLFDDEYSDYSSPPVFKKEHASENVLVKPNASEEEKKKFVDLVWPLMDEIEAYCSQLENEVPVPDEVVLFQMMMEATTEVYYEVYPVK